MDPTYMIKFKSNSSLLENNSNLAATIFGNRHPSCEGSSWNYSIEVKTGNAAYQENYKTSEFCDAEVKTETSVIPFLCSSKTKLSKTVKDANTWNVYSEALNKCVNFQTRFELDEEKNDESPLNLVALTNTLFNEILVKTSAYPFSTHEYTMRDYLDSLKFRNTGSFTSETNLSSTFDSFPSGTYYLVPINGNNQATIKLIMR